MDWDKNHVFSCSALDVSPCQDHFDGVEMGKVVLGVIFYFLRKINIQTIALKVNKNQSQRNLLLSC